MGHIHFARGKRAQAKAAYQNAITIREAALGQDHPTLTAPLVGLAEIDLAEQRPASALRRGERAVNILKKRAVQPIDLAEAQFVVARALFATQPDLPRALELAVEARRQYAEAQGNHKKMQAQIDAWLRVSYPDYKSAWQDSRSDGH